MPTKVLSATALALLLSVSAFGINAAIAQTGDTQSGATKKSLDNQHLTPVRPIRRVGDDNWPSANNQPAARETTGQSSKQENKDKQDTAQNTAKPDTKNSSLGNQSPPPDKPQDTAKQSAQPKQDTAKQDNKQDNAKPDKGFASIRLGTDSSGRVAINESQEKQVASVMRKHHVDTVDVKISVGSVAPANVKLGAVSSDLVEILPQFRGYSFFATSENITIVEPSTRKVVALIPVKLTATASRSHEERTTSTSGEERAATRIETRPSRTRTVVRERDVTVGQGTRNDGVPTEAEILAAPVVRAPAGTAVTRTYRSYQYEPDDDVVIIERRRPGLFPFW